jgi:hypothetical protein
MTNCFNSTCADQHTLYPAMKKKHNSLFLTESKQKFVAAAEAIVLFVGE